MCIFIPLVSLFSPPPAPFLSLPHLTGLWPHVTLNVHTPRLFTGLAFPIASGRVKYVRLIYSVFLIYILSPFFLDARGSWSLLCGCCLGPPINVPCWFNSNSRLLYVHSPWQFFIFVSVHFFFGSVPFWVSPLCSRPGQRLRWVWS